MNDLNPVLGQVQSAIISVGLKVLGAVALWIAGHWLIGLAVRLLEKALNSRKITFNLAGPVLAVRPYCAPQHYWQVYFDGNRAIRETFSEAGYPTPEQHLVVSGRT